jgi:hypothetical protein
LEATDQAFIGYFVYFYTVTSAGNPLAIATGTNTWCVMSSMSRCSCSLAPRRRSIIVRNLGPVAYLVLNYFFLSVAASHRLRRGHHSKMVRATTRPNCASPYPSILSCFASRVYRCKPYHANPGLNLTLLPQLATGIYLLPAL